MPMFVKLCDPGILWGCLICDYRIEPTSKNNGAIAGLMDVRFQAIQFLSFSNTKTRRRVCAHGTRRHTRTAHPCRKHAPIYTPIITHEPNQPPASLFHHHHHPRRAKSQSQGRRSAPSLVHPYPALTTTTRPPTAAPRSAARTGWSPGRDKRRSRQWLASSTLTAASRPMLVSPSPEPGCWHQCCRSRRRAPCLLG